MVRFTDIHGLFGDTHLNRIFIIPLMETKVVDLANCAIIALETQVTDLEGQRVTVDRRVAEVAEHVEIPAAG